jgi:hypothetical protein
MRSHALSAADSGAKRRTTVPFFPAPAQYCGSVRGAAIRRTEGEQWSAVKMSLGRRNLLHAESPNT